MKSMELSYDSVQFESRAEIGEIIRALEEWKATHKDDPKMETVQELIKQLEL